MGLAWTDLAAGLTGLGGSDAEVVAALYHNALGRDPSGAELAAELGRLAAGVSRAQLAVDVALGAELLGHQPAGGVWVADALGSDAAWRAGTGGLPGTPPRRRPPATDLVWLLYAAGWRLAATARKFARAGAARAFPGNTTKRPRGA